MTVLGRVVSLDEEKSNEAGENLPASLSEEGCLRRVRHP